ncbi:MAG: glycosyltransferase family 1 protein [Gammaproteobacteria bacterium]|nr:glycosyltransferase family 1 protein [Gammaproteobacteria bacterium]
MTSRIVVDTGRASTLNSGLGQVVFFFAEALSEIVPDDMDFTFLVHRKMQPIFKSSFSFRTIVSVPARRLVPDAFSTGDIWHVLNPDSTSVPLRHPRIVLTLHDLRILAVKRGITGAAYKNRLQKIVHSSVGLTAISEFTRTGMRENFDIPPIPFEVIRNGIAAPERADVKPVTQVDAPYLLALGLFEEKKRFHLLVEMMQYLPELNLLLVGFNDNAYGRRVKRLASEMGLQRQIHFVGTVDEGRKWQLYANCRALVFPSELEGFGLPVLEAMAMGKPVYISCDGALPETGGELANYFSVLKPRDMAGQIRASIQDDLRPSARKTSAKKREDYARTFTWAKAVRRYLSFYRSILD